jgi:hypothetical protein
MPRTLVRAPEHDRLRSLGGLACEWIEHFVVHGPGAVQGMPVTLGDEFAGYVMDAYAVDHRGRRLYDHGFLSRPKGCNKSGFGAMLGLFEALGPARFAGFAKGGERYEDPWGLGFSYEYAPGEPMGMSVHVPIIRIMATEEGQPLALDTPVPTPSGWTTVGILAVGDTVLDADGRPQRVMRETRVMEGLDCYAVTFSDGERVVASGSHLWTLERRTGKGRRTGNGTSYETVTLTTEQLATDYLRGGEAGKRYRCAAGVEWQLPEADLPIDPWLLGLWLGDGKTADASIAFDYRLRDEYETLLKPLLQEHEEMIFSNERGNAGVVRIRRRKGLCAYGHEYGVDLIHDRCGPCRRITNSGRGQRPEGERTLTLREKLRNLGVLGRKHVPAAYLRASAAQRHALLQGLMDSDGSFSRANNAIKACFTNADRQLIDDIEELLTSLGYKWSEKWDASVKAWRVYFVGCATKPPARLAHKVAKLDVLGPNARSRRRHVASVERVDSVPVKCIGIDTDDHLFLVGRRAVPTHNTGNVYDTIYFNLTDDEAPLSQIPGVDPGRTRVYLPFGGEIIPSTASSASKDGGRETWVCFDETHLYNAPELRRMYKTVTRNLVKRKATTETWFIETTTMFAPGEDSVAEVTFREAELVLTDKKRRGRQRLLYDHRWGECSDLTSEEMLTAAIREAFGEAIEWNDIPAILDEFYSLRADPADSRRFFLNAETSSSDSWIEAREWDACKAPEKGLQPRDVVTLGFDGSLVEDATCLVACRVSDGHLELLHVQEKPDNLPVHVEWRVDEDAVDAAVAAAFKQFRVVGFFADPAGWQSHLNKWHAQWAKQLKAKVTNGRPLEFWMSRGTAVVQALDQFHLAVKGQQVSYTPAEDRLDEKRANAVILRRHILNCYRKPTRVGLQVRKEYPKSPRKIDAAMAAMLAFAARGAAIAAGVPTGPVKKKVAKRIR